MAISKEVTWLDIYNQLLALEDQVRGLREQIWALRPEDAPVQCRNPVNLEGIWEGADLTEEDFAAAERSMFSYEYPAEE